MSLWKTLNARWGSGAGEIDEVRIDASTNSLQTIGYEHHEIHAGSSFTAHFDNVTANSDDDVSCIGFTTPGGLKYIHMFIQVTASSPAEFFLEEGVTITDGKGTEVTIYNRNRNAGTTSTVINLAGTPAAGSVTTYNEVQINDTSGYSAGTILDHIMLAGGEGPKAVGGTSRNDAEWVLDAGVDYFFRLQNVGQNVNIHEIHLDWYEHEDKH